MVPKLITVKVIGRDSESRLVFTLPTGGYGTLSPSHLEFLKGEAPPISSTVTASELRSVGEIAGSFGVAMAATLDGGKPTLEAEPPADLRPRAKEDDPFKSAMDTPMQDNIPAASLDEPAKKGERMADQAKEQARPRRSSFSPYVDQPEPDRRQDRRPVTL